MRRSIPRCSICSLAFIFTLTLGCASPPKTAKSCKNGGFHYEYHFRLLDDRAQGMRAISRRD